MSTPLAPPEYPRIRPSGTGGLRVAVIALSLSLIPRIGLIVALLVLAGFLIAGLTHRYRVGDVPMARYYGAGRIVALVAAGVGIGSTVFLGRDTGAAVQPAASHTVIFSATGSSPGASVELIALPSASATGQHVTLPWHEQITTTGSNGEREFEVHAGPDGGTVSCRITVDGHAVATRSASGVGATASCLGGGSAP
jgi:hypothetical protein